MRLYSIITDNFLPSFNTVRLWADGAKYGDVRGPHEDVVYPHVCTDVPQSIVEAIGQNLSLILGQSIHIANVFARLSPAGVKAPHQVHCDESMAQYTAMIYLNRAEHCQGGTSLMRHREHGFEGSPRSDEELAAWQRDMNTPEAWEQITICPMAPNRAFIFPSELMHRAEPVEGFGTDARDARAVIVVFFRVTS